MSYWHVTARTEALNGSPAAPAAALTAAGRAMRDHFGHIDVVGGRRCTMRLYVLAASPDEASQRGVDAVRSVVEQSGLPDWPLTDLAVEDHGMVPAHWASEAAA